MKDIILLENISQMKLLYNLLTEVEKINNNKSITFHEFITPAFFHAALKK